MKDTTKEKIINLLDNELNEVEFELNGIKVISKPPSLLEESKLILKLPHILKKFLMVDKDNLEILEGHFYTEEKLKDDGTREVVEVPFDLNNRKHLEYIYYNVLPSELREFIASLAYLDAVVKKLILRNGTEYNGKVSDLLLSNAPLGVHIVDVIRLSQTIFNWFEQENSVDPFLSKN